MSVNPTVSWNHSLANRLLGDDLPFLVVGPIVRRVDSESVTIMGVTVGSAGVDVEVYDRLSTTPSTAIMTGHYGTIRLGANLHLFSVRATFPSVGHLDPGKIYHYDIRFTNILAHGSFTDLLSLSAPGVLFPPNSGVVNPITKITFGNETLPSFCMPPDDFNNLRLVQASCRKPHGEGPDAFDALHIMLESNILTASTRPQQLILTGDQVYVDDVNDGLLYILKDAITTLLDTDDQSIPSSYGVTADDLKINQRSDLISGVAKFTAHHYTVSGKDVSGNHLVLLSEFVMMYVFAWSPELWPTSLANFPAIENIYTSDEMPNRDDFQTGKKAIQTFWQGLNKLRKTLANISTYMIFDDHDVSDDWFIDNDWVAGVYNSDLGKRIIRNALSSYLLFQEIGNNHIKYLENRPTNSHEDIIECILNLLNSSADPFPSDSNTLMDNKLLPVYDPIDKKLYHNLINISWDFTVSFNHYELIFLDCRTHRAYDTDGILELLGNTYDFQLQISGPMTAEELKLSVVIAPAPVFSMPTFINVAKGPGHRFIYRRDKEDWDYAEKSISRLLSRLTKRTTAVTDIFGTVNYGRILLLSGDVHFSYSQRIQYNCTNPIEDLNTSGTYRMILAQLTCSSLHNETDSTFGTVACHNNGYIWEELYAGIDAGAVQPPLFYYGYNNEPLSEFDVTLTSTDSTDNSESTETETVEDAPEIIVRHGLEQNISREFSPEPDWAYRIDFIFDPSMRLPSSNTPHIVDPPPYQDRNVALTKYLKALENPSNYNKFLGAGKEIVGLNNLSEIRFNWPSNDDDVVVIHEFWWKIPGQNTSFPLTRHEISMNHNNPSRIF